MRNYRNYRRRAAPGLLLDLLEQKSERMSDIEGMKHTDDMLVELSVESGSENYPSGIEVPLDLPGLPVLTVDRRLKERFNNG